ncbi:hypothetical protein B5F53_18555 [Blautia sp. An249]|uniref:hypothetical protein n=1 Tax=Blautia sp. An249 TaxID=1965603 RepID=UPI000B397F74|nr:hypothetical protein [Blautia sp. An249]OUO75190.1 hypothetical protein B5F53_18555 [Blautia sp. An249]
MIKNENDFLKVLIESKDSDNDVSVSKVMKGNQLTSLDFSCMLARLTEKEYIIQTDSETIHLYPWGIAAYKSLWKRIAFWIGKLLILTIKNLILFIGGILSGLIVAYGTFLINKML